MTLRETKRLYSRPLLRIYKRMMPYCGNWKMSICNLKLILSASCFAQLKRHRMSTIIAQDYNPQLGVTMPPSIKAISQQKDFMEIMRQTQNAYEKIMQKAPMAAAYVLTNAHRKRVLMKLNARELYHLARMRADAHAQWDIRDLTEKMLKQAKKVMPLTLMMACGKDNFPRLFNKTFPHE